MCSVGIVECTLSISYKFLLDLQDFTVAENNDCDESHWQNFFLGVFYTPFSFACTRISRPRWLPKYVDLVT